MTRGANNYLLPEVLVKELIKQKKTKLSQEEAHWMFRPSNQLKGKGRMDSSSR